MNLPKNILSKFSFSLPDLTKHTKVQAVYRKIPHSTKVYSLAVGCPFLIGLCIDREFMGVFSG